MANEGQYDSQTNIEIEDYEKEILAEREFAKIYNVVAGVSSVNGQTGDVTLTTSDLENTSDYQDGQQVADAIDTAIAGKQDILTAGTGIDITNDVVSVDTTTIATQDDLEGKQNVLTPGDNIQIDGDTISATDTTYNAGTGLDLSGTTFSVDTSTIATHQDITDEATARENADTNLQGQIDALTVGSGVIDVLGTYQDLQNYDTTHVKEDDIIKVLQDSTHSNAMSYYKWVITGNVGAWVYVGSEGPFYTKSEADVLLNSKQNAEDNSLETSSKTIVGAINEVDSIAKGANQALSYVNYATLVTEFNSLDDDAYNVGQNIYIQTLEVPDLWISNIESTSSTYTYVDDATFISGLDTDGYVQVGYYKLSALETQKVDLTNYVTNTDYATSDVGGVIKVSTSNGFSMTNGALRASTLTYDAYQTTANNTNIGKATLENVITGKGLIDSSYHDSSKQDTLVSGTNIKTVNNTSLLGSGNVSVGTITGITMNGSSKGTSGVVDLGTVITSHQDISGKLDKTAYYNDYFFDMPDKIKCRLNSSINMYFSNMTTPNYLVRWGQYTASTDISNYDDYVTLSGTATGSKSVQYQVYDRSLNKIGEGNTSVQIVNTAPASQTMLILGDSFVSQNYMGPDLRTLFTNDGNTLTLIGTKGSGLNKNEGYAGWKYTDFVSGDRAPTTPFWDGSKFNFSYYMQQQGYSTLDSVYIQLGTNDASSSSPNQDFTDTLNAASTIINSILAYNSNIKIYLGLTVMPTLIVENFAAKYNGIGWNWVMRANMQKLNKLLIDAYANNNSVNIVANNLVLDSTKDIKDNVHPNSGGYQKIAEQVYYTMMS